MTVAATAAAAVRGLGERVAMLGVAPEDPEPLRFQKATLTVATTTMTVLSFVWVGTYLALGLPLSAAIPFGYQVASSLSLAWFARTRNYRFFRFSQILAIMLLPFLLQWSLGGYAASSAVSVWALVGAFGAVFFFGAAGAIPWFLLFVVLTVVSGLAEPALAPSGASIPALVRDAFFVLNITGVSVTAYLLLQYAVRARDAALATSERLLLNVLPAPIAERLKRETGVIADAHDDVTVLFADVVDFTPFSERTSPERIVELLNDVFTAFDRLAERFGLEKIKTIGDAYMVVAGLPAPRPDHAEAAADMALAMQSELGRVCALRGLELQLRIGMHSGRVVAGIIGERRFIYDLWGDTVNLASRMESSGVPGRVHVTEETRARLADAFAFEPRGPIEIKGRGPMPTFLLVAAAPAAAENLRPS